MGSKCPFNGIKLLVNFRAKNTVRKKGNESLEKGDRRIKKCTFWHERRFFFMEALERGVSMDILRQNVGT